jgi:hypothetical protein
MFRTKATITVGALGWDAIRCLYTYDNVAYSPIFIYALRAFLLENTASSQKS